MDEEDAPQRAPLERSGEVLANLAFDGLEDFRITHPRVIGDVLRQLMVRKDFLTVESSNSPHRIVTCILEVNQTDGTFVYYRSAEPVHDRSLLEAQENYFSATQDGVRIQFVGGRAQQCEFEGVTAFCAALPQSLYRVQRRQFFRAAAPLVESYCCIAVLPDQRQVNWDIVDLSLDGLGLR